MADEGYDLKWKNHLNEVFSVVRRIRTKDSFTDVILYCENKSFHAHKVILAASSTFFERMLSGIPSEKAKVLVMTDVRADLLRLLLDFVYNGEAYVRADILDDFMATAEKLEIRGLHAEEETKQTSRAAPPPPASSRDPKKRPAPVVKNENEDDVRLSDPIGEEDDDDDELPPKRPKPAPVMQRKLPNVPSNIVIETASAGDSSPSKAPSNRTTTIGGVQIKPGPKKVEQPGPSSQPGPSRAMPPAPRPPSSNDDDIVEVEEDGRVKTEPVAEEAQYDYAQEGGEWAEEGGYGDEEYYEEGGEGDQAQYDESYAGEGGEMSDEQPQNIPPEISTETIEHVRRGVWRGYAHGSTIASFFCGLCGQVSVRAAHIEAHIRARHTGERPYMCSICFRSYAQKTAWRNHMRRCLGHQPILP